MTLAEWLLCCCDNTTCLREIVQQHVCTVKIYADIWHRQAAVEITSRLYKLCSKLAEDFLQTNVAADSENQTTIYDDIWDLF